MISVCLNGEIIRVRVILYYLILLDVLNIFCLRILYYLFFWFILNYIFKL